MCTRKKTLYFNDYAQRSRDAIRRSKGPGVGRKGVSVAPGRLHPREARGRPESRRIVSQHAGTHSTGELTRMSPWKFPLSSIGPSLRFLFAMRLPPVNSLTSHSLGASAEGPLLLAPVLGSPGSRLFARRLFLSI